MNAAHKDGARINVGQLREVFINHKKLLIPWMKKFYSKVYQYAFVYLAEAFKRFFYFGMLRKQWLGKYSRFNKKCKSDSFTVDSCRKLI
ncbi:MAG: hypothetical protein O4861_23110 [Trichodesmium sp. St16_bin4-tuft]|nr:hypothetical protein [Trichodesmium sp. MAG_R01]MDE5074119.1 hypothetical protein [Trichodesmium sp. St5_bin8]MDE5078337.1 hypothetical protein [Trichodesmium sp. St2_bin6]MDE5101061.1 hypothetical protein [Trichodesmium sp. St16_bin4-tuft]